MPLPPYLPHIIYATALSSLSLHLLNTRKSSKEQRYAVDGRISLLEGLATRLRSNEDLSEKEVTKILKLAGSTTNFNNVLKKESPTEEKIGWKSVFFGRPSGTEQEWDEESLKKLWEDSEPTYPFPYL